MMDQAFKYVLIHPHVLSFAAKMTYAAQDRWNTGNRSAAVSHSRWQPVGPASGLGLGLRRRLWPAWLAPLFMAQAFEKDWSEALKGSHTSEPGEIRCVWNRQRYMIIIFLARFFLVTWSWFRNLWILMKPWMYSARPYNLGTSIQGLQYQMDHFTHWLHWYASSRLIQKSCGKHEPGILGRYLIRFLSMLTFSWSKKLILSNLHWPPGDFEVDLVVVLEAVAASSEAKRSSLKWPSHQYCAPHLVT